MALSLGVGGAEEVDIPPAGTKFGTSIILPIETPEPPTAQAVEEYAGWMGMDLPFHRPLLWIAAEALRAPVPPNWRPCQDERGGGVGAPLLALSIHHIAAVYYFNFATGESLWDHPLDAHYRDLFETERKKLEEAPPEREAPALGPALP
jgi:hypothetical protein